MCGHLNQKRSAIICGPFHLLRKVCESSKPPTRQIRHGLAVCLELVQGQLLLGNVDGEVAGTPWGISSDRSASVDEQKKESCNRGLVRVETPLQSLLFARRETIIPKPAILKRPMVVGSGIAVREKETAPMAKSFSGVSSTPLIPLTLRRVITFPLGSAHSEEGCLSSMRRQLLIHLLYFPASL